MATDSYWQLEREYYTIAADHDLVIRVIELEKVTRTIGEGDNAREVKEEVPKKVHEFKVKHDVVKDASAYFEKMLRVDGSFQGNQQRQSSIDLVGDPVQAMLVWFKILHASEITSTFATTTMKALWEVLAMAHKYGLEPTMPGGKAWFEGWHATNLAKAGGEFNFEDCRMLLFPCHTFDHAEGFTAATKYLVYNATGHITERRPQGFKYEHLRLDSSVIQQTNAAKGRLKTILHRALYKPIKKLLSVAACACKAETLYAYEKALFDTGAWPLEDTFLNNSVDMLLYNLQAFSVSHAPESSCMSCQNKFAEFKMGVETAVHDTRRYFDGLCLDCMNASKPKFGDADADYWRHGRFGVKWDINCRVNHDQPTWYFSFMGRREKMIQYTQERKRTHSYRGN